MDWEQDFSKIISAVDTNIKTVETCLEIPKLHWWTFISKLSERKDCEFSAIINIRKKIANGEKLEKYEQKMLNENREEIILKNKLSEEDEDWLNGVD